MCGCCCVSVVLSVRVCMSMGVCVSVCECCCHSFVCVCVHVKAPQSVAAACSAHRGAELGAGRQLKTQEAAESGSAGWAGPAVAYPKVTPTQPAVLNGHLTVYHLSHEQQVVSSSVLNA